MTQPQPPGVPMVKIVLSACALFLIHALIARSGTPDAAFWLTGAVGSLGLIWYGLARA